MALVGVETGVFCVNVQLRRFSGSWSASGRGVVPGDDLRRAGWSNCAVHRFRVVSKQDFTRAGHEATARPMLDETNFGLEIGVVVGCGAVGFRTGSGCLLAFFLCFC